MAVKANQPNRELAGHYGFTAEELDFILNDDTRLRQGFGGQVKYRLGRDTEEETEWNCPTPNQQRCRSGR